MTSLSIRLGRHEHFAKRKTVSHSFRVKSAASDD